MRLHHNLDEDHTFSTLSDLSPYPLSEMTTASFSSRARGCVFPIVRDWPQAVLLFFFHARRFDHELIDSVPVLKCSSHDVFGQAAD